jgi:hypothetical protein
MTVTALLFLALKFGKGFIRKLIGHQVIVDVVVTMLFMWMFAITGTISGMMTGIAAGLIVSIVLFVAGKLFTHSRLERIGSKLVWVDHEGEWVKAFKDMQNNRGPAYDY